MPPASLTLSLAKGCPRATPQRARWAFCVGDAGRMSNRAKPAVAQLLRGAAGPVNVRSRRYRGFSLQLPSTAEFTQFSLHLATQLIGDDIAINAMLRERLTGGATRR